MPKILESSDLEYLEGVSILKKANKSLLEDLSKGKQFNEMDQVKIKFEKCLANSIKSHNANKIVDFLDSEKNLYANKYLSLIYQNRYAKNDYRQSFYHLSKSFNEFNKNKQTFNEIHFVLSKYTPEVVASYFNTDKISQSFSSIDEQEDYYELLWNLFSLLLSYFDENTKLEYGELAKFINNLYENRDKFNLKNRPEFLELIYFYKLKYSVKTKNFNEIELLIKYMDENMSS